MGTQLNQKPGDDAEAKIATVCVNAFSTSENGDEYADPHPNDPSLKWSVYGRTDEMPGGRFGIPWEQDFDSYDEAMKAARAKSVELGLDPDDIREY